MTNETMGNTTVSPIDGDFTIKPLTTHIDIKSLRQLMGYWHSNGIKDVEIPRMLKIYLGEPAWMNTGKEYPCTMFTEMAKGLKFRCRHDFIEALLRCKGFGFIWKSAKEAHVASNLLAFYTPIWHTADTGDEPLHEEEQETTQPKETNEKMQKRTGYINNNIYYKKKNIQKKNINYNVSQCKNAQGARAGNNDATRRSIEFCARQLLNYIGTNPDAYAAIVAPINDTTIKLMPELHIATTDCCPATKATIRFFNAYLYPYLLSHSERMMSINGLEGQSCWVANLVKKDFMQKQVLAAVNDTRHYMALHHKEMQRENRPLSPHEYQDPKTGQRFYDTLLPNGQTLQHRIPEDAPPKPSAQAMWSKFSRQWSN